MRYLEVMSSSDEVDTQTQPRENSKKSSLGTGEVEFPGEQSIIPKCIAMAFFFNWFSMIVNVSNSVIV